jgi:DNA-binding GntR family transcriptional regulator
MRTIKKPKSLVAIAAQRIRQNITEGRYKFGAYLSEAVLAKSLGISKTPVREALLQLQQEGLVLVVPHSGTYVFNPSMEEIAQLCETRLLLESATMRLAMNRAPKEFLRDLGRIVAAMKQAERENDPEVYRLNDALFHQAFVAHSGNVYLDQCYRLIDHKISALRTHLATPMPELMQESLDEHVQIYKALSKGDLKTAEIVLKRHITQGRIYFGSQTLEVA